MCQYFVWGATSFDSTQARLGIWAFWYQEFSVFGSSWATVSNQGVYCTSPRVMASTQRVDGSHG